MVQTQFFKTIKFFRSDNAHKYTSSDFESIFTSQGTLPHLSFLRTSQQNGKVKCKNHHILDTIWSLLIFVSLPKSFWGEATLIVVYTINRVASLIF